MLVLRPHHASVFKSSRIIGICGFASSNETKAQKFSQTSLIFEGKRAKGFKMKKTFLSENMNCYKK